MRHFEDLWNEAERVAESMNGLPMKHPLHAAAEVLDKCRDDAHIDEETLGAILFNLCAAVKAMEMKGVSINSAKALHLHTQMVKEDLLAAEDELPYND